MKLLLKGEAQEIAAEMLATEEDNISLYHEVDDIYNMKSTLTPELAALDYVHDSVTTDPHDAIRAGMRVYSSLEPSMNIEPGGRNEATRERYNNLETWVKHQYYLSSFRGKNTTDAILLSAIKYDIVVGQVEYLPWTQKMGLSGVHPNQITATERYGEYVINIFHPSNAFARFNKYGPASVLIRNVVTVRQAIQDWGEAGKKLEKGSLSEANKEKKYVTIYDYNDYDQRIVWGVFQGSMRGVSDPTGDSTLMMKTKHKLPFLNFVVARGSEGDDRVPLLHSIIKSKQYETMNALDTAVITEALSMSWAPRYAIMGPNGEQVRVIYGNPGKPIILEDGQTIQELRPPVLDVGLLSLAQEQQMRMDKSTVSRVLQGAPVPGGTAYQTINLSTKSAIKALMPYKNLAERAMGGVAYDMFKWKHYTKDEIEFMEEIIKGDEVPISRIIIKVKLTEDVTIDHQAIVTTMVQLVQVLGMPKEKALEYAGENDPTGLLVMKYEEMWEEMYLQAEMKFEVIEIEKLAMMKQMGLTQLAELAAAGDPAIMQILQQLQAALVQSQKIQEAQNGKGSAKKPKGEGNPPDQSKPPKRPGAGGDKFSPGSGGQSTTVVDNAASAEGRNQADRGGTQI
ncbi:MAG: hypothetical protein FVQ79_02275 [Planctomycetes bacterium]|nr:hypothetical protein [Planctomycetota bacterium]